MSLTNFAFLDMFVTAAAVFLSPTSLDPIAKPLAPEDTTPTPSSVSAAWPITWPVSSKVPSISALYGNCVFSSPFSLSSSLASEIVKSFLLSKPSICLLTSSSFTNSFRFFANALLITYFSGITLSAKKSYVPFTGCITPPKRLFTAPPIGGKLIIPFPFDAAYESFPKNASVSFIA